MIRATAIQAAALLAAIIARRSDATARLTYLVSRYRSTNEK